MRKAKSALRFLCAFALMSGFVRPSPSFADGPLNLPAAAGIQPGDILIQDFFNDWIKFDPVSNQLFSLPWDDRFVGPFVFDLDGAILLVDHSSSGRSLARLHTVTGVAKSFGPSLPTISDVEVLANGDLLMARPASSLSINGDVWIGGFDGQLLRFSRATGRTTPLPKPQQFSPGAIANGPAGETYVLDMFRGLQRVDLTTGDLSDIPGAESERFWASLEVFPDGDIVHDLFGDIYRLDPITGVDSLLTADVQFIPRLAIDENGDVWAGHRHGLYFINGATGEKTLRYAGVPFFNPERMVVVPSEWTPPPIPEPSSFALLALGILASVCCHRGVKIRRQVEAGSGSSRLI